MAVIHVPVLEVKEVVVVDLNQLPTADDLLELLITEAAPLAFWFDFAAAFLAQGNEEAFRHICSEASKDDVAKEVERFFGKKPTYELIQFHSGLAGLSLAKAELETDKSQKMSQLAQALSSLSTAQQLDPEEQLVSLGMGLLHVAKGEIAQARNELVKACDQKNNGQGNVVPLLALAGLLYSHKLYHEALTLYRRALLEHPQCPPEVRLGIAACLFKLGDLVGATSAYERVLALDSQSADAHIGLAIIKFNSINLQQGLADGLKLLVRAYELDPGHLGAVITLAHYCLLRGNSHQALALARHALDLPNAENARPEITLLIARAHHALSQLSEARKAYLSAAKQDPTSALAHLGVAQMYLAEPGLDMKSAATNATTELEQALRSEPAFFDALKILGHLVAGNKDKVKTTLSLLQSAVSKASADADLWELLAELSASTGDHAGSLQAYKKSLELHRTMKKEATEKLLRSQETMTQQGLGDEEGQLAHLIPLRLLNNTAVLLYRAGEVEDANALLSEAMATAGEQGLDSVGPESLLPEHQTAVAYNSARLMEARGLIRDAEKAYLALLESNPTYSDCLLRLGRIAWSKGDLTAAESWAKRALECGGQGTSDAKAFLSQLYMEKKMYPEAVLMMKALTTNAPAGKTPEEARLTGALAEAHADQFGALARGNLSLYCAPPDRKTPENQAKADDSLFRALDFYTSVLQVDPRNAFAANGLGAALAELGQFDAAQEVFGEVQAAVAASKGFLNIPDLFLNLANVALAKQEYTSAVRLYKLTMEKLDANKKSQALLYLARAHYDSNNLKLARSTLLRALHANPTDYQLRFNLALTMQEWAVRTFSKQRPVNDPTKLQEFDRALLELGQALGIFTVLRSKKRSGPEAGKLDAHVRFCEQHIQKGEPHLKAARMEAESLASKRMEQEKLREIAEKRRMLDVSKKQAQAAQALQLQEQRAREALEKQERLRMEWRQSQAMLEVDGNGDAGVEGDPASGGAGAKKKKKAKSGKGKGGKKGARAMAGDDEEPSDEDGREDENEDEGGSDGSDGSEGSEGGGRKKDKKKKKTKGKGKKKGGRLTKGAGIPGAEGGQQEGGRDASGVPSDKDLFGSDEEEEEEDEGAATREREKAMLVQTGLASDEDGENGDLFGSDSDDGEGGDGGAKRGRAEATYDGLEDDEAHQGAGGQPDFEQGGDEEGADDPARKRARRPMALADSDDEQGGGAGSEDYQQGEGRNGENMDS